MRSLSFTKTIGAGAFGTVYLAEMVTDRDLRRQVAVKVLLEDHAEKEMFLARMRDEARLLGLLQDDHVLKVIDLIELDGRDGIVMEYIEGVDINAAIEAGNRPSYRALVEIGAIVAGTLSRAHGASHPVTGEDLGVVHRDVKPANIMVTATGGLKLLDFGIAQARFNARESQTGQMVLGTLNYMAPDYIVTGEVTPALDVYGLGLSMYEMYTGEIYGQPKLKEHAHNKRLEDRLAPIRVEHPEIAEVIEAMLHWEPKARPLASDAEQTLLQIADEAKGQGLRRYGADIVPKMLAGREEAPDQEGLLGKTIDFRSTSTMTDVDSLMSDHPDLTDDEGLTVLDPERHPPGPALETMGASDGSEARTLIQDRELLDTTTRRDPNRTDRPSNPTEAPPGDLLGKAILRGVLVGSTVGGLAVALLAVILFY